jgi:hypothetical protein
LPKWLIADMLVSGASVLPRHAAAVLHFLSRSVAVSHGLPLAAQREAAGRSAELCTSWRTRPLPAWRWTWRS